MIVPSLENLNLIMINGLVMNEKGMLGKIASVIATSNSNIDNVSLEQPDGSTFANLNFVVQVKNRIHLAELIRNLRKITKINRINRVKSLTQKLG
jgi:guanosine-3',5'-bis(diphosphate) 3'-pyrophosphohydrolase